MLPCWSPVPGHRGYNLWWSPSDGWQAAHPTGSGFAWAYGSAPTYWDQTVVLRKHRVTKREDNGRRLQSIWIPIQNLSYDKLSCWKVSIFIFKSVQMSCFWRHAEFMNLTLFFGVDQDRWWSADTSGGHSIQRDVVPHTCSQTWNNTGKLNTLKCDSPLFNFSHEPWIQLY